MNTALKIVPKQTKYLTFEADCKQQADDLFIEGFANRYAKDGKLLVDRGNDLVEPQGINLEDYKSIPIIMFNHDSNLPIGKAVNLTVTEEGLRIKAKLSKSDDPETKRIRTLVKEGILRAFSIGFNPIKVVQEEIDGKSVNIIKESSLLEVSVVSIPMAEHSLFSVTSKALAQMPIATARNVLTHPEWFEKQGIPSQPIEAELSNPVLDIMKQSNVLLGSLIREIQLMSEKLDMLQAPPPVEEVVEEVEEVEHVEEETETEQAPDSGESQGNEEMQGEPCDDCKEDQEEEKEDKESDETDSVTDEGEKMDKKLTIIDRYSEVCNKILASAGY